MHPSLTVTPGKNGFTDAPEKTSILSAVKISGTTSNDLSVGLIQSITDNEFARLSDSAGVITRQKTEPLTSYTVARIKKGYNGSNTVIGGILTSTNRSGGTEQSGISKR